MGNAPDAPAPPGTEHGPPNEVQTETPEPTPEPEQTGGTAGPFPADTPAELAGADLFGHSDYARTLARAVLETEADYTFGLFGDWGLGKTTVLEEVGRLLRQNSDCAFVKFDAWRYQDDPFRREFLRDVAEQLEERDALHDWTVAEKLGVLDEDVTTRRDVGLEVSLPEALRGALGIAVLAVVLVLVVSGTIYHPPVGAAIGLVALMPVLAFLVTRLDRVIRVQQETVARKRLEDPDRFADVFRSLIAHIRRRTVVIAVDNLDRLPAKEALEVLSTVKTFLEPEAEAARLSTTRQLLGVTDIPQTRVVFVLAVDDDALRRHLRSSAPGPATGRDAKVYADEFLRKFFNASIRLRPLLRADLSNYIREHIRPVFQETLSRVRGATAEPGWPAPDFEAVFARQLEETVAMAAVIVQTPRRVRQFAANLALRLRLIDQRERPRDPDGGALLDTRISEQPALIAKLVLLEEEWPEVYTSLYDDETLWAAWHDAARRNFQDPPEGLSSEDWRTLGPFLRTSRRVQADALRPFLRLKGSVDELLVANYDRFRDQLVHADYGDFAAQMDPREYDEDASELSEAERQTVRQHATLLLSIFREELEGGRIQQAVNVVGGALSVRAFYEETELRSELLAEALTYDVTAEQVAVLDPAVLIEASADLGAEERARLLQLVAGRLGATDTTRSHQEEVVAGLATMANELDEGTKNALRAALSEKKVADDFWLYAALTDADHSLATPAVGQAALQWLATLSRQVDARSMLLGDKVRAEQSAKHYRERARTQLREGLREAPFRVLRAASRNDALEGLEDELVDALSDALTLGKESVIAHLNLATYAAQLATTVGQANRAKVIGLIRQFGQKARALEPGEQRTLLHACGQVLDALDEASSEDVETALMDQLSLDAEHLARFAVEHRGDVPASLRPHLLSRLGRAETEMRVAQEWPARLDTDRPAPGDVDADTPRADTIAAALGILDGKLLANDANPEQLASALNDWCEQDPENEQELRDAVSTTGGPTEDTFRGATVVAVNHLSWEQGHGPAATYSGEVVVGAAEARIIGDPPHELLEEPHRYSVRFIGALALDLVRDEEGSVTATVTEFTYQGPVPS